VRVPFVVLVLTVTSLLRIIGAPDVAGRVAGGSGPVRHGALRPTRLRSWCVRLRVQVKRGGARDAAAGLSESVRTGRGETGLKAQTRTGQAVMLRESWEGWAAARAAVVTRRACDALRHS